MLFFRKLKRPLFDKVMIKDIDAVQRIIGPEPDDHDLLGCAWAVLGMMATKDTIKTVPTDAHITDPFVFESCVAANYFIRQADIASTQELTPFTNQQYAVAQVYLGGYVSDACKWHSLDVVKARIEHYSTCADPMGSLNYFLDSCRSIKEPSIDYGASIIFPDVIVMRHTAALAHACAHYADILLKIVDQFGFDPDR